MNNEIEGPPAFSRRAGVDLGVLYCLSNPGMPKLYKIGFTLRTGAARARDLYHGYGTETVTGVPFPFKVVREWEFLPEDVPGIEAEVHQLLRKVRVSSGREFFHFEHDGDAIKLIEMALEHARWLEVAHAASREKWKATNQRHDRPRGDTLARENLAAFEVPASVKAPTMNVQERAQVTVDAVQRQDTEPRVGHESALITAIVCASVLAGVLFATMKTAGGGTLVFCGLVGWLVYAMRKDAPSGGDATLREIEGELSSIAARAALEAPRPPQPAAKSQSAHIAAPIAAPTMSTVRAPPAAAEADSAASEWPGFRCPHCWGLHPGKSAETPSSLAINCTSCKATFAFGDRVKIGAVVGNNYAAAQGRR